MIRLVLRRVAPWQALPPNLGRELLTHLYKGQVMDVPLFRGLPSRVQYELCLGMKPFHVLAHDVRHAKPAQMIAIRATRMLAQGVGIRRDRWQRAGEDCVDDPVAGAAAAGAGGLPRGGGGQRNLHHRRRPVQLSAHSCLGPSSGRYKKIQR